MNSKNYSSQFQISTQRQDWKISPTITSRVLQPFDSETSIFQRKDNRKRLELFDNPQAFVSPKYNRNRHNLIPNYQTNVYQKLLYKIDHSKRSKDSDKIYSQVNFNDSMKQRQSLIYFQRTNRRRQRSKTNLKTLGNNQKIDLEDTYILLQDSPSFLDNKELYSFHNKLNSQLSSNDDKSTKSSTGLGISKQDVDCENMNSSLINKGFSKYKTSNSGFQKHRSHQKLTEFFLQTKQLSKFKSSDNFLLNKNFLQPKISNFLFIKIIGKGRYGTVYSAIQKTTGLIYAIKKIQKKTIHQNCLQKPLSLEIKYQTMLNHPNIVKMYGCFSDKLNLYLIMEYMEEGSLFDQMKKRKQTMKEQDVGKIINEIGNAVSYLQNKNIAHRDIKPQNIVLSNSVSKLTDFGWVTQCNTKIKIHCGTYQYAAPQIIQDKQYDSSVDLWSIGILTYQLLVGQLPFPNPPSTKQHKTKTNKPYDKIRYPKKLSSISTDFLSNLLQQNPESRTKLKNLMKHPFLLEVSNK